MKFWPHKQRRLEHKRPPVARGFPAALAMQAWCEPGHFVSERLRYVKTYECVSRFAWFPCQTRMPAGTLPERDFLPPKPWTRGEDSRELQCRTCVPSWRASTGRRRGGRKNALSGKPAKSSLPCRSPDCWQELRKAELCPLKLNERERFT